MEALLALARGGHVVLAVAVAVLVGLVTLVALGAGLRRKPPGERLDLLLGITLVAAVLNGVLGLLLFPGGGPADGLHVVYGIVAVVALPLARILAAGPPPEDDSAERPPLPRRASWWLVAAG